MADTSADPPQVVSCQFDDGFAPALAVLCLDWPAPVASMWRLPGGWTMRGEPPGRFGFRVHRLAEDEYAVCLVWDRLAVRIARQARRHLLDSSLPALLAMIGTDLGYLLAQPIERGEAPRLAA